MDEEDLEELSEFLSDKGWGWTSTLDALYELARDEAQETRSNSMFQLADDLKRIKLKHEKRPIDFEPQDLPDDYGD